MKFLKNTDVTLDKKFIIIENGIVVECVQVDPFRIFSEYYASRFIEAPIEVESGWIVTEDGYEPPKSVV